MCLSLTHLSNIPLDRWTKFHYMVQLGQVLTVAAVPTETSATTTAVSPLVLVASLTNTPPSESPRPRRLGYAPVQPGLIACELEGLDVRLQRAALPPQPLAFGWTHSMSQTITWCDSPGRYRRCLGLSLPTGDPPGSDRILGLLCPALDPATWSHLRAACWKIARKTTGSTCLLSPPLCARSFYLRFPEILYTIAVTRKIPKASACLTSGSVLIGPVTK